jgi:hypothetical protein
MNKSYKKYISAIIIGLIASFIWVLGTSISSGETKNPNELFSYILFFSVFLFVIFYSIFSESLKRVWGIGCLLTSLGFFYLPLAATFSVGSAAVSSIDATETGLNAERAGAVVQGAIGTAVVGIASTIIGIFFGIIFLVIALKLLKEKEVIKFTKGKKQARTYLLSIAVVGILVGGLSPFGIYSKFLPNTTSTKETDTKETDTKETNKETVNKSNMTPEQCYEAKYTQFRNEMEKELKEQGEEEPYAEQQLVPQGMRSAFMEDCKLK